MAISTASPPATAQASMKPHLSFWQILNMNVGFFGIQFSFGLQQSNMSPIYQVPRRRRGQPAAAVAGRAR
jgi:hypothetical protein